MTIKPLYTILLTINNIQIRIIALAVAKEMIINLIYIYIYVMLCIITDNKITRNVFSMKRKKENGKYTNTNQEI